MNEAEGSAVIELCFREAGIGLERNYPFSEGGIQVTLDGFDPVRRVGFEFITTEAGDRAEFTPAVVAALEARFAAGELFLLLIDEADVAGAEMLRFAAQGFLATLRDRGLIS